MPISGIVISFDCSPQEQLQTLEIIKQDSRFELGECKDHKVPGVLETPDQHDDRAAINWLNQLNGVSFVDVVFVHFEETEGIVHELSN